MSTRRVGRARRAWRDRRWWHCGLLAGRGLGNHRPNQEPTSSVLREAHTRPSRVLKHSLTDKLGALLSPGIAHAVWPTPGPTRSPCGLATPSPCYQPCGTPHL